MASANLKIRIASETAADWTTSDPTLEAGRFGYESDTGKLKVGDGVTAWTSLAYFGGALAYNDLVGFAELDNDLFDFLKIGDGIALDSPQVTVTEAAGVVSLNMFIQPFDTWSGPGQKKLAMS